LEFQDKVALVTGAAGSIGKGIAGRFCSQGAKVFITDLDQTRIDQCCREIDPHGERCKGLAADVTDHNQVMKVVRAALSEFDGKIDILVNVAGIVALDSREIHYNEISVVGSSDSTPAHVETAVELISTAKIPAEKIATHILGLEEIHKGFDLMKSGQALRVVLKP